MIERVGDRDVGGGAECARRRAREVLGKLVLEFEQHRLSQRGRGVLEMARDHATETIVQQPSIDASRIFESAAVQIAVAEPDAGGGLDEFGKPTG